MNWWALHNRGLSFRRAGNLKKNLSQIQNLTAAKDAKFFNGYGKNSRIYWGEVCQYAESIQHNDEQSQIAAALAILTFKLFDEILTNYYRTHMIGEYQ